MGACCSGTVPPENETTTQQKVVNNSQASADSEMRKRNACVSDQENVQMVSRSDHNSEASPFLESAMSNVQLVASSASEQDRMIDCHSMPIQRNGEIGNRQESYIGEEESTGAEQTPCQNMVGLINPESTPLSLTGYGTGGLSPNPFARRWNFDNLSFVGSECD